MEGLGIAANAIAVLDLSTKVATLCSQYSGEVAGARADIERLHAQIEHLGTVVQAAQLLIEGPQGQSLSTSQKLIDIFQNCCVELNKLKEKLEQTPEPSTMRRLGLRALEWPFSSKEVDQILSSLKRHEEAIHLGLEIDQTSAIVEIQEGVDKLTFQAAEEATVSPPSDPGFVHRPAIEKWMHDQYKGPGGRMALVGMGGFGKTQLAIEFVHHQVHTDKPFPSVFWVRGNSRATFEESYHALADVLAVPRRHVRDADILALVRDHLQRDDVSPWLMVVDNADDAGVFVHNEDHDSMSKHPLASYLPKSIKGKILVMSRSLDVAERLVGHSQALLQLSVMQEDQALELLTQELEEETDEAAAIELVRALDYIPLAIIQAAAYINRRSPRLSVTSYLERFRMSENQKDSFLRGDKGELGRHEAVSNSVVVTWQMTFEQIKREQPSAANLLSLMCQFQPQKIPENMLHSYDDNMAAGSAEDADGTESETESDEASHSDDFENDMDTLRDYSLVAFQPADCQSVIFYEMHPLVQFCTRSWISEFGDPKRWSRLFVQLAAIHFPIGEFETWDTCQRLMPHIEPLLRTEAKGQGDILYWAELLRNASFYMADIGEPFRAIMLGKESTEARKNALGADHPDTLASLSKLARTYSELGRWEEAEQLEVEVLETCKAKLGTDHHVTLNSLDNLATILHDRGRGEEANRLMIEVLGTLKARFGPDNQQHE